MGSHDKKNTELCKIEELAGNDPSAIEDEINNRLNEGWHYRDHILKGNKIYLVFIKGVP